MKKTLLLFIAVAISAGFVCAQDTQIPDFKMTPMLIKADGSLSKLEKPTQEVKSKMKGVAGYGGSMTTFLNILGGHSPIKLDPKNANFVVKLTDAETDPEGIIYFTKVIVSKDTRELELAQGAAITGFGGGKGKSVQRDDIKPEFTKVAPGVYKFIPATPLTEGTEWAIVLPGNVAFCFGTTGEAKGKGKK
jgi:hypothetical protein